MAYDHEGNGWGFRAGTFHKWFGTHWKEASSPAACEALDTEQAQRDLAVQQANVAKAAELRAEADALEGVVTVTADPTPAVAEAPVENPVEAPVEAPAAAEPAPPVEVQGEAV